MPETGTCIHCDRVGVACDGTCLLESTKDLGLTMRPPFKADMGSQCLLDRDGDLVLWFVEDADGEAFAWFRCEEDAVGFASVSNAAARKQRNPS